MMCASPHAIRRGRHFKTEEDEKAVSAERIPMTAAATATARSQGRGGGGEGPEGEGELVDDGLRLACAAGEAPAVA